MMPNGIAYVNVNDGSLATKWSYSIMKTWSVNWETGEFDIQFDKEVLKLTCLNSKVNPKILHEFIGGYIFMSLRNGTRLDTQMFYNLTDKR